MRSLFSPFSLLSCCCAKQLWRNTRKCRRRKSGRRRNFLVFWFFDFAIFGGWLFLFCWATFSLFLSLSLSFVSLIILSLFSGEKNTPTRIISLTRRACAEENSSQNCVLVVVINLSSFPSSSLDSFFSRGGVLWKKRETVTFIWDGRTRLWKTRSERWPVLLLLLQLIPQLLPFAVSIVLVHWGI